LTRSLIDLITGNSNKHIKVAYGRDDINA